MKAINLLLARFAQLVPNGAALKEAVRRAVEEELDLDLKPEQIKIVRDSVYLILTPAAKNLVFIKREQIAASVREKLGEPRERKVL